MATAKPLEDIMKELPPEARHEVEDFAAYLWERKAPKRREKPRFDWVGALKGMDMPLTSVELQHQISKWRAEEK